MKISVPSRKNGRFSSKKSANRSLTAICPASASTWLKSGLYVASSVRLEVRPYLALKPNSPLTGSRVNASAPASKVPCLVPVSTGFSSRKRPRSRSRSPLSEPESVSRFATSWVTGAHDASNPERWILRTICRPQS